MTAPAQTIDAALAMNRFGLGAKAGEVPPDRPQRWLLDQIERFEPRPPALAGQPGTIGSARVYQQYLMIMREEERARAGVAKPSAAPQMAPLPAGKPQASAQPAKGAAADLLTTYGNAVAARLQCALASDTGFPERLVHFWSNHFAVSVDKLPVMSFAGDFEFTAIRPNIRGKFVDLLEAVVMHPAMLLFLDQFHSVGPNSITAQRLAARGRKAPGLNENLAREILELHTLGVRTGYSQADVTELARALTGLTVAGLGRGPATMAAGATPRVGTTMFVDAVHEPGGRQIMGRTYAAGGLSQVRQVLSDLAVHPATARHISLQLARHFVADDPPPALVDTLSRNFLATGGDLPSLYRTLVEAPEAWPSRWDGTAAKFKSPWDWVVSSLRVIDTPLSDAVSIAAQNPDQASRVLNRLGQPIWKPGSPAGYADDAATWAGSAALMRRVEFAAQVGDRTGGRFDARSLAPAALPGILGSHTADEIARADTPAQGLALMLMAPEFLRR